MNHPQSLDFINSEIRPICEDIRDMMPKLESIVSEWALLSSNIPNTSEDVDDGRELDGAVSRLVCSDIHNVMTQVITINTQLNQAGVFDVINKPCVRPSKG